MKLFPKVVVFFHSIRFRLVLWFSFILALVLFGFSTFIYYNQALEVRGETRYRLVRKFDDIIEAMAGFQKQSAILQPTDVFMLVDVNGKVLFNQGIRSSQDVVGLMGQVKNAQADEESYESSQPVYWIQNWQDKATEYFFIIKPVVISGQTGFAILGSPFDPYGLTSRLFFSLLIGSLLTIAVASGGGLWLADRAMRPVHSITLAARSISETDLNMRLNLTGRDELAELANTFDGMLARLQVAFDRQRQFVADASHELRTPLTIVNLEASRALSSKRTVPEYQRVLGVIRSENEFMSHLVHDLLTLARMDAGQQRLEKKPLDLSDIALEALERLEPLAESKKVNLEAGDLPETIVDGDRQSLLQVASNLVENAIKYAGGDQKWVRVETGMDGPIAWLRVTDNGQGISPEHLPHLFDRFYRVDKARSREASDEQAGNGLGLSIVEWIVRAHGGEVQVGSEPGLGTTFEVRLDTKGNQP